MGFYLYWPFLYKAIFLVTVSHSIEDEGLFIYKKLKKEGK